MMAALTPSILVSMILKIVLSLTPNLEFLFVVLALVVAGGMLAASTKPQSFWSTQFAYDAIGPIDADFGI